MTGCTSQVSISFQFNDIGSKLISLGIVFCEAPTCNDKYSGEFLHTVL